MAKVKGDKRKQQVPAAGRQKVIFAKGDGIGPEVIESAVSVVNAAVEKAYAKKRSLDWEEVLIGKESEKRYGKRITDATLAKIEGSRLILKGPVETQVGGGGRSLNVALRLILDLYANIRPVKYIDGLVSPLRNPGVVDMVIFRENTDDLYTGIEWPYNSLGAAEFRAFMEEKYAVKIAEDAGIGIKQISKAKTERVTRMALQYAIKNKRRSVTIMHKGNIMKYTEGAFREWAYEVAKREFRSVIVTEEEVNSRYRGAIPKGRILVNDRIADNMFQQIIAKPAEYDIILAPNLNGDYISDAAGALIGDIGMLGSADIGDNRALFEAVHGTAEKYAGKDVANPSGAISAGALMLDYIGWEEAAALIRKAMAQMVREKRVTRDLASSMNVRAMGTKEFTETLIGKLG